MSLYPEKEDISDFENMTIGFVLSNIFLPEEILINILIFVDWKDLLSCRLVCQSWRRIIDSFVCFEKLKIFSLKTFSESFTGPLSRLDSESIPFHLYFAISKGAFGKNLLKNGFGSGHIPHECQQATRGWTQSRNGNNLNKQLCSQNDCPRWKHWDVKASGGDGWAVEAEPVGCDPLPAHLPGRSCFVTSYHTCAKEQLIELAEQGLSPRIMDEVQPQFDISEWYARRWDCGIQYRLHVALLDHNYKVVQEFEIEAGLGLEDDSWHEVQHSFKEYGPGVRYVFFNHSGSDTQFWAGHYGSKMAGGSVIARIPSSQFQRSEDCSSLD